MPIFQDQNGFAVKFFLQKDIPQEIQAELCETITSLGGRVESKVPRSGYILVQPSTQEEERLRLCWTSQDRPERHFVPYTYVEACKIAGMVLKQIFVQDGQPIRMHIHPSIANVNARTALGQRIMHSGGDPHASLQSSRVILADPNTEIFHHLVKVYQGVPEKYIESYLWVKKCVEKQIVVYTPLVYKNPGGRRPGEERTQFTEEDEDHLCRWIAAKIPYKETGGRTGNRLYQQLCDLANDPEYAWVSRHTWQSWRERYKKNASRLDNKIAGLVEEKKPTPGEKGQYGYVRQAEEKPKRTRKRRTKNAAEQITQSDEEFLGSIANEKGEGGSGLIGMQVLQGMHGLPGIHGPIPGMDMSMMPGMYMSIPPPVLPLNGAVNAEGACLENRPAARGSPAEEEMDDTDEPSQWQIRVGNDAPPAWAKRREVEEVEEELPIKRARTEEPARVDGRPETELPNALNLQTLQAIASFHVIDQAIRDIAKETRFTVEEVQEYYDKHGEMERTRTRFWRMRAELQANFPTHE